MIRPLTLARLLSVGLPVVVVACSSEPGPVALRPPVAKALVVTGLPSSVNAGVAANGVVTAKDSFGNTAPGYTGTVHFTSTDSAAVLPADYTFVSADRGSYTFTVTFRTAGPQTVSVTDVATRAITGAETITITPVARDVFAVGDSGVLHYDGTSWTRQMWDSTLTLFGVWGTSGADMFAVGRACCSSLTPYRTYGTILHYDGTSWTTQMRDTTIYTISGVWGSSGSDVFAVGDNGTILHYDGASWTRQMRDTTFFFERVWGSSGSDVFALGDSVASFQWSSTIRHYDGTSWTTLRRDTTIALFGVWGSSGHDVFAVGDSILHYDGMSWTAQRESAGFAVWGSSGHDVFAVGDYGDIQHYNGTNWTLQYVQGPGAELDGVWGSSGSDVFAVGRGGAILHYDGSAGLRRQVG